MAEEVKHITENGKYRIVIEKAAGVKTGDGFKVEANSDYMILLMKEIKYLYGEAKTLVADSIPAVTISGATSHE